MNSSYCSIVVNDKALPYPSPGKVEATQAVKLKPLFVALSVLGFHQHGWLLSDKLWEQSCGCQEKACYTHTVSVAWQRILKVILSVFVLPCILNSQ